MGVQKHPSRSGDIYLRCCTSSRGSDKEILPRFLNDSRLGIWNVDLWRLRYDQRNQFHSENDLPPRLLRPSELSSF
ncbi:hypothetical protein M408DRAFT_326183 [Serendipita vermifera MAFF 305830]|uniref:Uncharacterized protein n=1 Tax=Serendipita vermifera MAFF 305830 TaxID=933852 RepID=A0A0C3BMZ4_SERVB|nr:hypothetical protein M408DRAFT_326183 [Serendipita vermifera MAFF 305830]